MPKRKRKKYSRPQKPFDKIRIQEENVLKERYGLKNKREIWKADAAIRRIRNLAKQLIVKSEDEKQAFINGLGKKGFEVKSIADALALDKEDWLKRRLQTIVVMRKLALTAKQARQFVTHKQVSIGNQTVNIPSYQVNLEEEPLIKLNVVLKLQPKKIKEKTKKVEDETENVEFVTEKIEKEIAKDITIKEDKIEKETEKLEKEIEKEVSEKVNERKLEKDIEEKAEKIDEDKKQVEKEIKQEVKEKVEEMETKEEVK